MSWQDAPFRLQVARFAIPAGATTSQFELSTVQNAVAGANLCVRAINIELGGSIDTGTGETAYWTDVLAAKLLNVTLFHRGEERWNLTGRGSIDLMAMERTNGINLWNKTFTASATRRIEQTLRYTMLDEGYRFTISDGLVPARALHDSTFTILWAADEAYPFTAMVCSIYLECYQLNEDRANWTGPEYKTDKIVKTGTDLVLPGSRIYNRLVFTRAPSRATAPANDFSDTVFSVTGDHVFYQSMFGDQLTNSFFQTNPFVDDASEFFLPATQGLTDIVINRFQPLLWPGGERFGERISKGYSCYYKPLNVASTRGALSPAGNVCVLATWIPVEGDETLASKAMSVGLGGRAAKPKTASKSGAWDRQAAQVLPAKVV